MAGDSLFYKVLLLGQIGCYCLAAIGYILDRMEKRPLLFYIPFYFVYIHIAAFWAVMLLLYLARK